MNRHLLRQVLVTAVACAVAVAGCSSSTAPDAGMAVELMGDGGHVTFLSPLIGDRTTFTVEFWIKLQLPPIAGAPNPERNAIYMEGSDGLQRNRIFVSNDNIDNPNDDVGSTTLSSWPADGAPSAFTGPLIEGVWQHIAYVRDGSILRIYVDGILEAQGPALTYTGGAPTPEYHLGFVLNSISGDEWGRFAIDDLRVSSVARYAAGFSPPFLLQPDADTLSLWHFDETSGSTTADAAGQEADAILSPTAMRVLADR